MRSHAFALVLLATVADRLAEAVLEIHAAGAGAVSYVLPAEPTGPLPEGVGREEQPAFAGLAVRCPRRAVAARRRGRGRGAG